MQLLAEPTRIVLDRAPHVHVHILGDDNGEALWELCCHNCAGAVFLRFRSAPESDPSAPRCLDNPLIIRALERYCKRHFHCLPAQPGRDPFAYCPPYRDPRLALTVDLRAVPTESPAGDTE